MQPRSVYEEVGHRIRTFREAQNVSQETLAERVGLTRTSVTNIEQGRQRLLVHVLLEIARALSVDVVELLPKFGGNYEEALRELPESYQKLITRTVASEKEVETE